MLHAAGLSAALALLVGGASARVPCPDAATAGKGFRLENTQGQFVEVMEIGGHRVKAIERLTVGEGQSPRETTSMRGLLILSTKIGDAVQVAEWEGDLAALLPPVPGKTHELAYVVKLPGAVDRRAHMQLVWGKAPEPVEIGGCRYDTWQAQKTILFLDSGQKLVITDAWSPVLSTWLRRTVTATAPGAPQPITGEISFEGIGPRKAR